MNIRLAFAFIISLVSCQVPAQVKPFNEENIEIGIVEKLESTIPMDLEFMLEDGSRVSLNEHIDKPTILSFVYFDCPGMCGPLLAGVADVITKLDMNLGEDYDVITFSFDPKDSPDKARAEKANFVQQIDPKYWPHWNFLTSSQETINKITNAVGWRYKAQGLDFAHPSAIMIISPEGKITRYLYGVSYLPFDVKMALIEAQKGIAQPTINKILEYCFAYDPQGRGYTLQITRIVGFFTIIIALAIFVYLIVKGRRKTENK
ncbi:MAG: SCO family protein [Bacteroidetes bacterium]|jgi:protein SCO1|nr:SCO family protein [Bacteroidota bacterium]MBT3748826.1 SCO family protein [Bacteroidota bacterium]MBT4409632.1 SCO family protein [Bacteroidota bacterium]MBT7463916.1 SCO family protein [Bacteroidota bacterium]